jgi:hypothetical protein
VVKVLFDNNAGRHERVGLESKLHHDATNNGQLIRIARSKVCGFKNRYMYEGPVEKRGGVTYIR